MRKPKPGWFETLVRARRNLMPRPPDSLRHVLLQETGVQRLRTGRCQHQIPANATREQALRALRRIEQEMERDGYLDVSCETPTPPCPEAEKTREKMCRASGAAVAGLASCLLEL